MATRELVSDEANIMAVIDHEFEVTRGHPYPLGVSLDRGGANFAVYSRHARFISLVIYLPGKKEPLAEFPLDARFNRTGDIWHVFIRGMDPGIEYGWRADGPSFEENPLLRFDRNRVLIDPHARALSSRAWGDRSIVSRPCVVDQAFDWGLDQPLNRHLADSIIYELHVRGFTQDPSSGAKFPGTFQFLGLPPDQLLRPEIRVRYPTGKRLARHRVQGDGQGTPRGRY
jgi:glycogen operon protein